MTGFEPWTSIFGSNRSTNLPQPQPILFYLLPFIAFDVHYFQFMMKRQIAAQRGRQKLNHAVSALHTINLLAGKIPEEPMPIFDPAIYRASVSVDDQPSAAGYGSDLANPARGTNIAKQFCRDIQLQNTIQQKLGHFRPLFLYYHHLYLVPSTVIKGKKEVPNDWNQTQVL